MPAAGEWRSCHARKAGPSVPVLLLLDGEDRLPVTALATIAVLAAAALARKSATPA